MKRRIQESSMGNRS